MDKKIINKEWTEPSWLNKSDWSRLKHIKKLCEANEFAEAMDFARYNCDTVIREEIPPNIWLQMGGTLTNTGKEKLAQLIKDSQ